MLSADHDTSHRKEISGRELFFQVMDLPVGASTRRSAAIAISASKPVAGDWREPEPGVLVWHTPSGRTYVTAPTVHPA
jgi:hypothetical protein